MFSFFVNGSTALVGLGLLTVWGSDITLRHTTLGRTPLEEWLACCRDLYQTTHNTHKRQTNIHAPVGFEPTIPASTQPLELAMFSCLFIYFKLYLFFKEMHPYTMVKPPVLSFIYLTTFH